MAETVTLDVSREGVVKNLADQFTNRYIFISEALQNARRAGASEIMIVYQPDENLLTFYDDGSGINDFNNLFTLGKSGWDAEVIEKENPFGLGAAAMLFIAHHIAIHSNDKQVVFNTADVLEFKPVTVSDASPRQGTEIQLSLHADIYKGEDLLNQLIKLVKGFPVPVYWNYSGHPMDNCDAIDDGFIETDIGLVKLSEPNADKYGTMQWSRYTEFYLQGLPVSDFTSNYNGGRDGKYNIVHLDTAQFRARVPDRTNLIDADIQEKRVREMYQKLWRQRLQQLKGSMDATDFSDQYHELCSITYNHDLMVDMPIPLYYCYRLTNIPIVRRDCEEMEISDLSPALRPVPGSLFITEGGVDCYDPDDVPPVFGLYAYLAELTVVDVPRLPKGHWAYDEVVDISDLTPVVKTENPVCIGEFTSYAHSNLKVIVCDHFTIGFTGEEGRFPERRNLEHYLYHVQDGEKRLIIPRARKGDLENLLRQTSSYTNYNDEWMDGELERDVESLGNLVDIALAEDKSELLAGLVGGFDSAILEHLKGQTFTIHISQQLDVEVSQVK